MLHRAGLEPRPDSSGRPLGTQSDPNEIEGYADILFCVRQYPNSTYFRPSIPGSPVQMTPEYVLNPLAIYRMARRTVPEKHAPEESTSPLSSTTSSRKTQPQQEQTGYNERRSSIQASINNVQQNELPYHQGKLFLSIGTKFFAYFLISSTICLRWLSDILRF